MILITLNYYVDIQPKNEALNFFHISTHCTLIGEKFLLIQNHLKLKNWDSHEFHYICNISARINIVSFTREQWSLNKTGHTGKYMMQQETTLKDHQKI